MNRVTFTYKNGRERLMSKRDADILQALGHGTYQTRDLVADRTSLPEQGAVVEKSKRKYTRKDTAKE
ncbi:hypothetical protein ACOTF6_09510 [Achromobacter xylosoxidans]